MKKAVMYGAGNIGRGFITQLFYESGYATSFIDVNMTVIDNVLLGMGNSSDCSLFESVFRPERESGWTLR